MSPAGGVGALARRVRGVRARARRLWELSAPPPTPTPALSVSPATSPEPDPPLLCWPLDHFYSPVPDNRALAREPARSRVWPPVPRPTPGIEWRGEEQVALLRDHLGSQESIDLPAQPTGNPRDYHTANEMFSRLDGWMLQGMLRHFRPRRMVEVGCGWSSLLTARVNREHLGGELHFTCIEPYPPDFLTSGIDGISELVVAPVQEAPLDKFLSLADRDVLFIDSSHTVKTGGDVPYLFEEVLPRLAPGVVIHVHDIALPLDYPEEWVLAGRAWNEQYLVRAFLAFNSAFRILLGVSWLNVNRPDVLAEVLPDYPQAYGDSGASLWIQRTA